MTQSKVAGVSIFLYLPKLVGSLSHLIIGQIDLYRGLQSRGNCPAPFDSEVNKGTHCSTAFNDATIAIVPMSLDMVNLVCFHLKLMHIRLQSVSRKPILIGQRICESL